MESGFVATRLGRTLTSQHIILVHLRKDQLLNVMANHELWGSFVM